MQAEPINFYITQEMIVRSEEKNDWKEILDGGKTALAGGGKVIVGVTEFVKEAEFFNWLNTLKDHQE